MEKFMNKSKKLIYTEIIMFTIISGVAAFIFSWQYTQKHYMQPFVLNLAVLMRCGLSFCLFEFIFLHFVFDVKKLYLFIFKYRFLISLGFLIFGVVFKINGSSIGLWDSFFGEFTEQRTTVFGDARAIRSDEWAVYTPMTLSQVFNMKEAFPYFSDVLRAVKTDVFIVYGQPVWNIAVLFRPFHWGFLLLGASRGLSFFWCAKEIGLFLVSFEFSRIITKDNRILSFISACFIAFSPTVQWWFTPSGGSEILIFSQLIIVLFYNYMKTCSYKIRAVLAAAAAVSAGGYALVFYPAWQVPIAYITLGILIWVFIDNYKDFVWNKTDLKILGLCFVFTFGLLGYIVFKSRNTISSVMNTVYPGARFETGGGNISSYINYILSPFLPFKDAALPSNVCEVSVFFDLFPAGYILSFFVLAVEKNKDRLLKILLAIALLFNLWIIIPFYPAIAKVTLLYLTPPNRMLFASGFLSVLILIRALSLFKGIVGYKASAVLAFVISVFMMSAANRLFDEYFTASMLVKSFILIFMGLFLAFTFYNKKLKMLFVVYTVIVFFISGLCVNPIEIGIRPIEENKILQEIRQINASEEGIWIVEGEDFILNNFPLMAGVPVLNSTNTYPDLDKWHKIDEEHLFEDIYNRYAHISLNITEDLTSSFELTYADAFTVNIIPDDLKKLEIKYILSERDLEMFNGSVGFNRISQIGNFKIYKLSFDPKEFSVKEIPENVIYENDINVNCCFDGCAEENEFLNVFGWAFAENLNTQEQSFYIEITDKDGNSKLYNANKQYRPDVAAAFGNEIYNYSGFNAAIGIDNLSYGENTIRAVIEDNGKFYKSEQGTVFTAEEK